ncbi:MAG: mechanosensitive ion channel family protein [Candidatus Diapherotrites archaeon]|nr:mechanosensitive ion channel family protein [Candidatus Diapherotrites archaeon]
MAEEVFFAQYLQFLAILAGTAILAVLFDFLFKKFAEKTMRDLNLGIDVRVLKRIAKPIFALIIALGFYLALISLPFSELHAQWISGLFFVIGAVCVTVAVSRLSTLVIEHWFRAAQHIDKSPKLLEKLAAIIVYLIGLSAVFIYFQIETTPVIAALGLSGLAVGLALQSTLSNLFAGVTIVSDRPINVGDYIELESADLAGYVEDIGWRSTRLRTFDNDTIVVPNAKLADTVIKNRSQPGEPMSLYVKFAVAQDSDLDKVEKITNDIAREIQRNMPGAVKNFEPFIRFKPFSDYGIPVLVVMKMETYVDQFPLTHAFMKELNKRFRQENIRIALAFPPEQMYYAKKRAGKKK